MPNSAARTLRTGAAQLAVTDPAEMIRCPAPRLFSLTPTTIVASGGSSEGEQTSTREAPIPRCASRAGRVCCVSVASMTISTPSARQSGAAGACGSAGEAGGRAGRSHGRRSRAGPHGGRSARESDRGECRNAAGTRGSPDRSGRRSRRARSRTTVPAKSRPVCELGCGRYARSRRTLPKSHPWMEFPREFAERPGSVDSGSIPPIRPRIRIMAKLTPFRALRPTPRARLGSLRSPTTSSAPRRPGRSRPAIRSLSCT